MTDPQQFFAELLALCEEGGIGFVALIALAFGIAFALLSLWQSLLLPDAPVISAAEWKVLLKQKPGHETVRERLLSSFASNSDKTRRMQEIGQLLFSKPQRRFPFAFILISAAPLLGLLGTVSGMLKTFSGMSGGSARAPIDVISSGISEALITTQTGLIIGVPTFIVCAWLKAQYNTLVIRFQQIESNLLQSNH